MQEIRRGQRVKLISDPSALSDPEMYERLMKEYPDWVRKAKNQGLLNR